MTVEHFNSLSEEQKKIAIFDAEKVTERSDDLAKYELFKIDNFFVETKTSIQYKFKRVIETFTLREVPAVYASPLNPPSEAP